VWESKVMLNEKLSAEITIAGRRIGPALPAYVIAELSANHNQSFDQAVRILHAARDAGADAVKLQTYTADTINLRSDKEFFRIKSGTLWDGRTLHELYQQAFTPWEWQPKLKEVADGIGMHLFSSAFDDSAVDFLEQMNVPAHKVASFELVDIGLIQKMALTGKPLIMSTGMASEDEIVEAVDAARAAGAGQIALLKCTSAYPASPQDANLRTIPAMAHRFGCPVGLSDHTMGVAVPVVAVALGANIIEKHLCLRRADGGPDAAFSLEPEEFRAMVDAVRTAEKSLGQVQFSAGPSESGGLKFRRSLFVVEDIKKGELFSNANVRSIRPSDGLHPRYLSQVLGKHAACDLEPGTPLSWTLVER
jgi:pseudaminic acid synthase